MQYCIWFLSLLSFIIYLFLKCMSLFELIYTQPWQQKCGIFVRSCFFFFFKILHLQPSNFLERTNRPSRLFSYLLYIVIANRSFILLDKQVYKNATQVVCQLWTEEGQHLLDQVWSIVHQSAGSDFLPLDNLLSFMVEI